MGNIFCEKKFNMENWEEKSSKYGTIYR